MSFPTSPRAFRDTCCMFWECKKLLDMQLCKQPYFPFTDLIIHNKQKHNTQEGKYKMKECKCFVNKSLKRHFITYFSPDIIELKLTHKNVLNPFTHEHIIILLRKYILWKSNWWILDGWSFRNWKIRFIWMNDGD